jgi:hypothetical protein
LAPLCIRRLSGCPRLQVSSPRNFAQSARLLKLPLPCIQPSRRTWLACASVTAGAPSSASAHSHPGHALTAHQLTLRCAYLRRRSSRPSAPLALAGRRRALATHPRFARRPFRRVSPAVLAQSAGMEQRGCECFDLSRPRRCRCKADANKDGCSMPRETSSEILSVFWLQQGLLLSSCHPKRLSLGASHAA